MSSRIDLRGSDVSFALHDPATALASLFRPVSKGQRPKGLEVHTEFDGLKLMFTCWEWLDTRDQSVLLAAVGMAGLENVTLSAAAPGEIGQQLWADLEPTKDALKGKAVVVTTTYYALLQAAGLPTRGGETGDYERIKEILYRLSQLGCRVKKDGYDWSMRMLSYASSPDGTIHIALNERISQALGGGQNVRISMDERRQLKTEPAQVMHAWLTAITRPGAKGLWMRLDAIAARVWGVDTKSESTQRTRRQKLVEAIADIESQGWKVEQKGRGVRHQARFIRPKIMD